MIKVIKCDFYRLAKSKSLYAILAVAVLVSGFLSLVLRSDVRIGISIFGNLTTFKSIGDLVVIGTQYYKGLGFLVAIIVSVFIGQEYLWKTLGNKSTAIRSRLHIYLSKTLLLCVISLITYIVFQCTVLLLSGQHEMLLTSQYFLMMISGIFPYIALGSVFTLISTLMKNNVYAVIACLGYVLLSEIFVSLTQNIASVIPFTEVVIKHSVYGMSQAVNMSVTVSGVLYLLVNALFTILISTIVGFLVFRRQET